MYLSSKILAFAEDKIDKFRKKAAFLREKTIFLNKIEVLLLVSICLSLIFSTFLKNEQTSYFLTATGGLYVLYLVFAGKLNLKFEKCNLFYLLYLAVAVFGTFTSTLRVQSLHGLMKTLTYFVFYLAVLQFAKDNPKKAKIPLYVAAASVCVQIAIAFIQTKIGVLSGATWQDSSIDPELAVTRVFGTLQPLNPNLLGGYFVATIPILWALAAKFAVKRDFVKTGIFTVISIFSVTAVFMTGCRGAYIATFASILIFAIAICGFFKKFDERFFEKLKRFKKLIIGAIAAVCAGALCLAPKILNRILSIFTLRQDSSTSFRFNVYESSVQMFRDNFLIGIGPGNQTFREIYGLYMRSGFDALSTYCVFLEIAVESGIFALTFFVLFLYYFFNGTIRAMKKTGDPSTYLVLTTGITSVAGVMIHGFTDTIFFRPQVQLVFWTCVGTALAFAGKELPDKIN